TNAPKSVRLRTLPETRLPIEYLETTLSQGSGKVSFKDSEMRRASGLTSVTTASTTSPGETTLDGFFTFFDQDISETCTRPSTPSCSSTNAPSSVTFVTRPVTREPAG